MVIVILGVLSAFALPRFADFGQQARVASLNALAGAIRSAANIAHAQQLANSGALGAVVNLEGLDITMVNGYPTADADGITAAAQVAGDYAISTGGAAQTNTIVYTLQAGCEVTYTPAQAAVQDTAPITATPDVEVDDSTC
jgi:MSHA pilin protein MshA